MKQKRDFGQYVRVKDTYYGAYGGIGKVVGITKWVKGSKQRIQYHIKLLDKSWGFYDITITSKDFDNLTEDEVMVENL